MKRISLLFFCAVLSSLSYAQNFNIDINLQKGYYPAESSLSVDRILYSVTDKEGNTFTVAAHQGSLGMSKYISKFNSRGEVVWLNFLRNRYPAQAPLGIAIALDTLGNFYYADIDSSNQLQRYFVPRDSLAGGINYPYTSNPDSLSLKPSAMAISNTGVQFIAGQTSAGLFAITNNVWMRTDSSGTADKIITDSLGNVFVVGTTVNTGNRLKKYDAAGNLLFAYSPALNDSNNGTWLNVFLEYPFLYVVSQRSSWQTHHLVKLNAITGVVVSTTIIQPGSRNIKKGNQFYGVRFSDCNYPSGIHQRPIVFSYDTSGHQLWADTIDNKDGNYNSTLPYSSASSPIYSDSSGMYFLNYRSTHDTVTILKYSFNGALLWSTLIKSIELNNSTQPLPSNNGLIMAFDAVDTIVNFSGRLYLRFLNLDKSTGAQNSLGKYTGPPIARVFSRTVTKDKYGNFYSTGNYISQNGLSTMLLQKTDAMGNVLWTRTDTGKGGNVIIDTLNDYVYVIGNAFESYWHDYGLKTWKYDLNGNMLLSHSYNYSAIQGQHDYIWVTFDKNQDIYLMSSTSSTSYIVLKLSNSNLDMQWKTYFSNGDYPTGIYVTPSNNVVVCNAYHIFCYTPTGTLLTGTNGTIVNDAVVFDENRGDLCIVDASNTGLAYRKMGLTNDYPILIKSGFTNMTYPNGTFVQSATQDSSGNIYALVSYGSACPFLFSYQMDLVKINANLDSVVWIKHLPIFGGAQCLDLTIPAHFDLYIENYTNPLVVASFFSDTAGICPTLPLFTNINVMLYDSTGNLLVSKALDDTLHFNDYYFGSYFDQYTNQLKIAGSSEFETGWVRGMNFGLTITDPHFNPYRNCSAHYTLVPDTTTPHNWFALNQATGTGPLTYNWSWGDGNSSTGAIPSHTYSNPGNYSICLSITDANGCTATYCDSSTYVYKTDATVITVNVVTQLPTGIAEQDNAAFIRINPNPAYESVTVSVDETLVGSALTITDVTGRVIANEKLQVKNTQLALSDLSSGVYFVTVGNEKGRMTRKLVKE